MELLGFDSFVLGMKFVKFITVDLFRKLHDEERLIFHFAYMSNIPMLAKIFFKMLQALLRLEEFLYPPEA